MFSLNVIATINLSLQCHHCLFNPSSHPTIAATNFSTIMILFIPGILQTNLLLEISFQTVVLTTFVFLIIIKNHDFTFQSSKKYKVHLLRIQATLWIFLKHFFLLSFFLSSFFCFWIFISCFLSLFSPLLFDVWK